MSISKADFKRYRETITFYRDDTRVNVRNPRHTFLKKANTEFFDKIYFEREHLESDISESILIDSENILSLEGITGCGKSTILEKVLSDIKEHFCILDFNTFCSDCAFYGHNSMVIHRAIANRIRDILFDRYFMNDFQKEYILYEFLLLYDDDKRLRIDFLHERNELRDMFRKHSQGYGDICSWYGAHRATSELMSLHKSVREKANYTHVIMGIVHCLNLTEKYIVVLDNVDRLPKDLQPFCYSFAIMFHRDLRQCARLIICIRPENAHMPRELATGGGSELIERISLAHSEYQSEWNAYLDSFGFYSILSKRHLYYSNQEFENKDLSEIAGFLMEELSQTYAQLVLIDLANQSIRVALDYHCRFVWYLLSVFSVPYLKRVVKTHRYTFLMSCLLGWIVDCGEVLQDPSLNLHRLVQESETSDYGILGCDLSYLILVNLLIECHKRANRPTSLEVLIGNLSLLGYEEEEIRTEVFNLYSKGSSEFGHIITIHHDETIIGEDDLKPKIELSLNLRGKRLVETVAVTFTFINRFMHKGTPNRIVDDSYYRPSSYTEQCRENIELFAKLAFIHSLELASICKNMRKRNWLHEYKKNFCIDFELHLTRILGSNDIFLSHIVDDVADDDEKEVLKHYKKILNVLLILYKKQVNEITTGTTDIYDFEAIIKELLNLSVGWKIDMNQYIGKTRNISKYLRKRSMDFGYE